MPRLPKLLVVNPNTSEEISSRIDAFARSVVGDAAEVTTVTARFGFSYLATRVSTAIAAHAALDITASAVAADGPPDAIVLACFGDPGLDALQELVGRPVAGFAEAGLLAAAALPGRFLIAVNGSSWCQMLEELVRKLGIELRVAGIESIESVPAEAREIAAFVDERSRSLGAARAVVGGAGLIALLPDIIAAAEVPVLDPHREAFLKALRLARSPSIAPTPGPRSQQAASGLSRALSRIVAGDITPASRGSV